jgi:hypothetical protein
MASTIDNRCRTFADGVSDIRLLLDMVCHPLGDSSSNADAMRSSAPQVVGRQQLTGTTQWELK